MSSPRKVMGVPLERVAEGLDLAPDELKRRVLAAGQAALIREDGTVALDKIDRVRECARQAPSPVARIAGHVSELMQKSGVAPIAAGPSKPNPQKAREKANHRPAAPAKAVLPPVTVGLQRAEVLREQVIDLDRQLAASREALEQAKRELAGRDAQLAALQADRARAEASWHEAARAGEAKLVEARAREDALRAELVRAREERRAIDEARLDSVFRRRGLVGEDEPIAALRALMDARRFASVADQLHVAEPEEVLNLLRSQIALHCGRPECPIPSGPSILRVSVERCETCGGSDIRRGIRRFSEALMLHAILRVVIVGGSPSYHKMLREGVDKRVDLRLVPGDARRTRTQAQADLSWAQLVIVWGGTILDHKVSGLYEDSQVRTLRIAHRGLSGLLERAVSEINDTA